MGGRTPRGTEKDVLLAAFEAARSWSGLLVSLATGSIVFTATFVKNFVQEGEKIQDLDGIVLLRVAWIVLGVSVIAGVSLLGNLAALLNKGNTSSLDIYGRETRVLAIGQILTFIAGGVLLLVFFVKVLS